ncbi:N-acetylmuramic acid 6-phosphate etherase [Mesoterricola silvestris]|uniref:N-acetylmuramic acid 6-phosphate etherase n=1 Tax=Mesoterricola silvestris TaxID=2927979 RepID=A0AA48GYT1_9BACT|nr:N-acetylmuramic acid 6-phosphate etherase [Mesoterricola silvestris]BDU72853.1 N-acetylmuramic acid 6-phosphate etherase [Mesoterricola silvestris]
MALPRTEQTSPGHAHLDEYGTLDLVGAFIDDQAAAALAVRAAAGELARAVDAAAGRLEQGGRIIYVGAGTSGRLGLLDSVELHPTFSWPPERALALLAGGPTAVHLAVEGAEDDRDRGAQDLAALGPGPSDVVVVLAASGATPFALGALEAARSAGALTIGIANNPDSPLAAGAEVGITLDTGPEVISGSTRLKAGTAQKIALNTFSSAVMVRLNKVYGNLMVDVRATNAKLVRRAIRLVGAATGAGEDRAREAFEACGGQVKTAIVALGLGLGPDQARERLAAVKGSVRAALKERA